MNDLERVISTLSAIRVVVTDANGNISGVTDSSAFSAAGFNLAAELAVRHADSEQIAAVLTKHARFSGADAFPATLIGAINVLLVHILEPSFQALDGDVFDPRSIFTTAINAREDNAITEPPC
jgi:hypothetical protein